MQQVTSWLEKLGMSEYAQRFADNDIDFSILGDLTDQDLKDLGVASLGHRRKILRAIAELDRPKATVVPLPRRLPRRQDRRHHRLPQRRSLRRHRQSRGPKKPQANAATSRLCSVT
jgi:hypothetical protein